MPPSLPTSCESSFTHIAKSGPTAARTARTTSTRKRERFSVLPPYSSVRLLVLGDRNEDSR